jgi:mannitol/fructose-specific phosphotransferase system IIA component (Ntr-type)
MILGEVFDQQLINMNLQSREKNAAFEELIGAIAELHPELESEKMLAAIHDRESKLNTAVMSGVAVPHGCYQGADKVIGAIGISSSGIEYDAPDHKPVHVIFLVIMGEGVREKHLRVLSRVLSLLNAGGLSYIQEAKSALEVYELLCRYR